jgi:hypothetical protein
VDPTSMGTTGAGQGLPSMQVLPLPVQPGVGVCSRPRGVGLGGQGARGQSGALLTTTDRVGKESGSSCWPAKWQNSRRSRRLGVR